MFFGRGGVSFLLASALAGAKAEVETLKKFIGFYGVICLCALCARMAQSKGRERTTMKNRAQQRKKQRTPRTPPKTYKKHHFGSQNGSQNRSRDPLFRSWRPVSCKIDPKTRPRALLGASGGRKKPLDAPKAAPTKPTPPPPPGGKSLFSCGRGAKIEGPGFEGPLSGAGGRS